MHIVKHAATLMPKSAYAQIPVRIDTKNVNTCTHGQAHNDMHTHRCQASRHVSSLAVGGGTLCPKTVTEGVASLLLTRIAKQHQLAH